MAKDYYDEKRVSNSSLSWFQISPKYFKLKLDKLIEEEEKQYFKYGQQVHMYILEPKEFDKEYAFLDYETPKSQQQKKFCDTYARLKKGTKNEKLLKAYKEAYSSKDKDEKLLDKAIKLTKDLSEYIKYVKIAPMYKSILSSSLMNKLNESKNAVLNHKVARTLVFDEQHNVFGNTDKLFIQNEFQINWEHPETGLPCKSLIDRLVIDYEHKVIKLIDLKTTSHLSDFKASLIEFNYHRQFAFYWMAIHWYFKNELHLNIDDFEKETFVVAIGKGENIEVKVFNIRQPILSEGLDEIERIMPILSWHWENEKWDYPMRYYEGTGIELI